MQRTEIFVSSLQKTEINNWCPFKYPDNKVVSTMFFLQSCFDRGKLQGGHRDCYLINLTNFVLISKNNLSLCSRIIINGKSRLLKVFLIAMRYNVMCPGLKNYGSRQRAPHHIIAEKITVYSLAQHVRFVRCPMPSYATAQEEQQRHTNTWTSSLPPWPLSPRQRARHKCHRITGNAVQIILCPILSVLLLLR